MELLDFLHKSVAVGASDIFIVSGQPLSFKVGGVIIPQSEEIVLPPLSEKLIRSVYGKAGRDMDKLMNFGDDDFSLSIRGLSRFRISTYKQRGSLAAIIRVIAFDIPDYHTLKIPEEVIALSEKTKGLILVTGPAGGGKSTTLACIIDEINAKRNCHIITLEDPIEFIHRNKKSVISQREISTDTTNYVTALRSCLRQAPDVILVGEMRDYETIKTAMTAAETGHLVISTLHTMGAVKTIDRIIDVFPPNQQQQIRLQLSMLLQSVVSQQLVPDIDGALVPSFEIMHLNSAIQNMIRESKVHQIDAVIASSAAAGMIAMDASTLKLYRQGVISSGNALKYALNYEAMAKKLSMQS